MQRLLSKTKTLSSINNLLGLNIEDTIMFKEAKIHPLCSTEQLIQPCPKILEQTIYEQRRGNMLFSQVTGFQSLRKHSYFIHYSHGIVVLFA